MGLLTDYHLTTNLVGTMTLPTMLWQSLKSLLLDCKILLTDSVAVYFLPTASTSKVSDEILMQVQACGSMVTEEQPYAMLIPMEYFFMGYGLYRPYQVNGSPRSPLSPSCISPELLSPESMGVKLKPIKTRTSIHVWHIYIYCGGSQIWGEAIKL